MKSVLFFENKVIVIMFFMCQIIQVCIGGQFNFSLQKS